MTVVGDVAQTGSAAGTSSWDAVLAPYVGDRWRLRELTVNYRTPAEIMGVAAGVLAELDPELEPPVSVRETGVLPWRSRMDRDEAPEGMRSLVEGEVAAVEGGTVAVLVPEALERPVSTAIGENDLVSVLTVDRAKGLEFDAVVVVAPDEVVAGSARGLGDLYVALTRATKRLGVVDTAPPLPYLSGMSPAP